MSNVSGINPVEQIMYNHLKSSGSSTQGTKSFSSYLNETKSLKDIFNDAAKKYDVSANLLMAIGMAESSFRVNAESKSGAQGVMQLMPKTAASLGVTDSFDAEQNIMGGAKYISQLLDKYDGDTKLALAAYNAGMNNVKKYGGIPPFEETQNYVVKVLKYMKEGINPGDKTVTTGAKTLEQIQDSVTDKMIPIAKSASANSIAQTTFYHSMAQFNHMISNDTAQTVDSSFSYDEYMKFLDLLLNNYEKSIEDDMF